MLLPFSFRPETGLFYNLTLPANEVFMKNLFFAFILLSGAVNVFAQTRPTLPEHISAGVLNGKALSLPKPEYPAAAKAVRAGF